MEEFSGDRDSDEALLSKFFYRSWELIEPNDVRALLVGITAGHALMVQCAQAYAAPEKADDVGELIKLAGARTVDFVRNTFGISSVPDEEARALTDEAQALVDRFLEER